MSALLVPLLLGCVTSLAQQVASRGTAPFLLDGNRVYAELSFVRPDGSVHQALAFVDMGSPSFVVTESLFKAVEGGRGKPVIFEIGNMLIRVPAAGVTSDPSQPYSVGSDLKVEAVLGAGVLRNYEVMIDYQRRTLTLAQPGTLKPRGIPIPFQMNPETGLIAVKASINNEIYPVTIDNGSAYTWFRQSTVKDWLNSHPDWERGVGAIGASNMMMSGDRTETEGLLLRIPEIFIGPLNLRQVGVLGAGPSRRLPGNLELFDWYSKKNAVAVIGWLGGNVLKSFHLTIDYANRTMYWLQQTQLDSGDLDQVGLTLKFQGGDYIVAAVATRNGRPTVENVQPGDKLIRIDKLETKHATWGAIYNAMHGIPGEIHVLKLERGRGQITVPTRVTSF